jgi:putative membrane protein
MYIKKVFPLKGMIRWSSKDLVVFFFISLVPVVLFDVFNWEWLHLPWLPIGLLGTALAFIQGFKNNASYDRLWEARKIWGGIVNESRTFTIMTKDYITNEFATEKVSEAELTSIVREMVHRHVAWMTALRYQLRAIKGWEYNVSRISKRASKKMPYVVYEDAIPLEEALGDYISSKEKKEILAKGNRASQLLGIQSRRLKELKSQNLIDDFRHMEMKNMLKELYTLQGKAERIKNFPYPRQFATLNLYFLWVFILLIPFGVMNEFDMIGNAFLSGFEEGHAHEGGFLELLIHFVTSHFVWTSIPFSMLLSWVFYTLEKIGTLTENPFEGTINDVPITDMSRGIEIDIRQLIDDHDIPEPYEWKNSIVL